MTRLRLSIGLVVPLLLGGLARASFPVARATGEGRDLLLRDFKPRSMLVVPVHEVERAAFPAIDVHNLVKDARGEDREVPVDELLARMDRLNLKRLAA